MKTLAGRQKKFCDEYLIDLNPMKAAIRAGYSEKSKSCCYRLLQNECVQEYLSKKLCEIQKNAEISQNEVIRELSHIAFANGCDFARVIEKRKIRKNGEVYGVKEVEIANTEDLSEAQKAAVASIKMNKYGITIAAHDKIKALELLGKHLGMFQQKTEWVGNIPIQIIDDIKEKDKNDTVI